MSSSATRALITDEAQTVYERMKPHATSILAAFDDGCFDHGQERVGRLRHFLEEERTASADPEERYLNDLYVLHRYVDLLSKYGELWQKIASAQFSSSWCSLQDALDLLREVKRFSQINLTFFETQLTELERAYPYSVFASVGMLVERFDCSICGLDIDSDECCHVRGSLYRGVMAYGIARSIVALDHVALVTQPEDKRCVVQYDDVSEHFKLVRLLAQLITTKEWRPAHFSHLQYSERRVPNPEYRELRRNDFCFCGSRKKFKKCCIDKTHIEREHVDLVAIPRSINGAVL